MRKASISRPFRTNVSCIWHLKKLNGLSLDEAYIPKVDQALTDLETTQILLESTQLKPKVHEVITNISTNMIVAWETSQIFARNTKDISADQV